VILILSHASGLAMPNLVLFFSLRSCPRLDSRLALVVPPYLSL
jgi:hypothetical protein